MAIKSYRRKRNLFDPNAKTPYKLSRSRIEVFVQCPRCFYLSRRLGIERPRMPAFTLNSAVDALLKKEFDIYRMRQAPHPLMKEYKVDAIPFVHPMMDQWRENFKGVQYHDKVNNLIIFGAVDDIWITPEKELCVVDYKSTSTKGPITLEGRWKEAYKRQLEIYQWLLRKQDLVVSNTGYFVYCNADKGKEAFDEKLIFGLEIIPYEGNDRWVDDVIIKAHECLKSDVVPEFNDNCEHCQYAKEAGGDQKQKITQAQQEFSF